MIHETSFQIINNYYTRAQHRASELLLYNLFKELCETDVDSEKKHRNIFIYNQYSSLCAIELNHLTSLHSTQLFQNQN